MDTRGKTNSIKPGDAVRIMTGSAAGMTGIVSAIKNGKAHIINLFRGSYDIPVNLLQKLEDEEAKT